MSQSRVWTSAQIIWKAKEHYPKAKQLQRIQQVKDRKQALAFISRHQQSQGTQNSKPTSQVQGITRQKDGTQWEYDH